MDPTSLAALKTALDLQASRLGRLEKLHGAPEEFERELRDSSALAQAQSAQLRDLSLAVERLITTVAASEQQHRVDVAEIWDELKRLKASAGQPQQQGVNGAAEALARVGYLEAQVVTLAKNVTQAMASLKQAPPPPHVVAALPPSPEAFGALHLSVAELRRLVDTKVAGAREAERALGTKASFKDVEALVANKADKSALARGLAGKADANVVEQLASGVAAALSREECRQLVRNEVGPMAAALTRLERRAAARSGEGCGTGGGHHSGGGLGSGMGAGDEVAWVRRVAAEEAAAATEKHAHHVERAVAAAAAAAVSAGEGAAQEARLAVAAEVTEAMEGRYRAVEARLVAAEASRETLETEVRRRRRGEKQVALAR